MKQDRNRTIDFFKVLLVLGMICAHSLQFFSNPSRISFAISTLVNLITFSGFMFCFGYAVNMAYLNKERKQVAKKLIKNSCRTLIVFYISGIAYETIVSKTISATYVIKIILLFKIPGYSEFLAAFFILNLLTLIFFNQFKWILHNNSFFVLVLIVSLLSTFIPYSYVYPIQLGLVIGSTKFSCFPILQYMGYYILGMYFEKNTIKFNLKLFIVSLISSLTFITYMVVTRRVPLRFPPSLFWILGAAFFLYLYYVLSIYISNRIKDSSKLYFIGENTLYFLLCSNLSIFILRYLKTELKVAFQISILIALVIIILNYAIIYGLKKSLNKIKEA